MLKRFTLSGALALAALGLVGPANAKVRVDPIVVNQGAPLPENTNVRVNLFNEGTFTVQPSQVELQVRETPDGSWRTIKSWNSPQTDLKMAAGERRSLDYLPGPEDTLDPALCQPNYELRALVDGVGETLGSLQR